MDGIYELNQRIDELEQGYRNLQAEIDELKEMVFTQNKTIEGVQHLFVKAGEYQGRPRGRLPRDRRTPPATSVR
jgi:prefoldin subunit 5